MPGRSVSRDRFGLFGSSSRAPSASSSSSAARASSRSGAVRLALHVPALSVVLMPHPALDAARGRSNTELAGELEIEIPERMGKRRCRRISVGLRSRCRLLIPGRGWEEDTIFERKVEVRGAIVLNEGIQRFDFNLIVPFHLGPHDWHQNGSIELSLFAEVEGLPKPSSSWFPRSVSPRGHQSPTRTQPLVVPSAAGPSSPRPPAPDLSAPDDHAIAHDLTVSWEDPVSAVEGQERVEWLVGTTKTDRQINLVYNPNPELGINTLDLSTRAEVAGMGSASVRWTSEIFTVSAPLTTVASIVPEPGTTVYTVRVVITQTTHIRSPRDDPTSAPHEHTRRFVVYTAGYVPDEGRVVKKDTPVLFHGADGPYELQNTSLLPADDKLRPSTLPGVMTPIKVSHALVLEVWFSNGPSNGHPELKIMKLQKAVELPSCLLIPRMLDLPTYEAPDRSDTEPCPQCHLPPDQQLCRTCQTTLVPHARHDLAPQLVGNARGVCSACSDRIHPMNRASSLKTCMCALRDEEGVKAREMARRPGLSSADSGSQIEADMAALKLQEEERGRRR